MRPALTFHGTGDLNGLTKKQQLLGHGCLTGVGVRNNGEGAARVDVAL